MSNLLRNVQYLAWLLTLTPGVLPALLFLPGTFKRTANGKSGGRVFLALIAPPVALLGMYVFVFVDKRYVGGSLLIVAVVLLAKVLPQLRRKWQRDLCSILSVCGCIWPVSLTSLALVLLFVRNPLQISSSEWDVHRAIANEMQSLGLRTGDRISYIGLGIRAYWPSIAGLHIVSEIPVRAVRRGIEWDNVDTSDSSAVDLFWTRSRERRADILGLLHRSGARAVVSDWVPPGADTSGWIRLKRSFVWRWGEGNRLPSGDYKHELYIHFFNNDSGQ
jgi:hypothetical protein